MQTMPSDKSNEISDFRPQAASIRRFKNYRKKIEMANLLFLKLDCFRIPTPIPCILVCLLLCINHIGVATESHEKEILSLATAVVDMVWELADAKKAFKDKTVTINGVNEFMFPFSFKRKKLSC